MKRKDEILLTALKMFNETNTQAVTTNHIAKAMGISPGNLHYHYKNREEIIQLLYIQMKSKLELPISELPLSITELIEHQKTILTVTWEYRFFQRELLFLLSRDAILEETYVKDNIAHRARIILVIKNLIQNKELEVPYDNAIEYIADSILLTIQFWNPYMLTLGQGLSRESLEQGIQRTNILLRPFLTTQALKTLASLEA